MTDTTNTRPIRTFHPRRGRMSSRHTDAHTALWPTYGLSVVDGDSTPLDLAVLFGRSAPVVVEIGFGMGDSLAAMAAVDPGRDYLGVEVHTPGIGNLFALIGEAGLTNVRVAHGDAIELIQRIAPGALAAVHVFFPDPWPKARHHKRRLIQPANVALLAARLRPGGLLHCATDWPDYAAAMVATLDAAPNLIKASAAAPPRPAAPKIIPGKPTQPATATVGEPTRPIPAVVDAAGRPVTKFERRGVQAGRPITDLRYLRR